MFIATDWTATDCSSLLKKEQSWYGPSQMQHWRVACKLRFKQTNLARSSSIWKFNLLILMVFT